MRKRLVKNEGRRMIVEDEKRNVKIIKLTTGVKGKTTKLLEQ